MSTGRTVEDLLSEHAEIVELCAYQVARAMEAEKRCKRAVIALSRLRAICSQVRQGLEDDAFSPSGTRGQAAAAMGHALKVIEQASAILADSDPPAALTAFENGSR